MIGLDLGTSLVKAVRFDREFRAQDTATETTAVHRPAHGRSEQDMTEVWAAARRVIGVVATRSPDPVELLAITAQGDGCWLVDAGGAPVRPALLWNDNRAAPIVADWHQQGVLTDAFGITGCHGAPGLANGQLRWLREHEPEVLDRADCLLSCGSWVYHRLTGRRVLDESDAANPFLDTVTRTYSAPALDLYGLTDLRRLLPEVVRGADRVAPLGTTAAAETGLPAGTPVVLAPYDVAATAYGCGAIDPGQAFAILGTTLCVGTVADDPRLDRAPNGITLPGAAPDRWLICYPTMTGTEVLGWTAALLGLPGVEELVALADTATPGEQPLLLPYLSPAGERSPFLDSTVRGSLLGLDLRHGRADVARAALDGLTLAVRDCLTAAGPGAEQIALSGGGARSALWCQIISDATGCTTTAPDTAEVGARGATVLGALHTGLIGSLAEVTPTPSASYSPDRAETERFDAAFARFRGSRHP